MTNSKINSSFNKGVSNPAESSKHTPFSLSFSPSVYLILIPFVAILWPVGIITFAINPKINDFPTLLRPKTPIFIVSSFIIFSYISFLSSL